MAERAQWRRLAWAAASVPLCLMALGLLMALAPAEMTPRSLQLPGALEVGLTAPGLAYAFYLGDSLYVFLALWLFLALAKLGPLSNRLALLGLAAACGKAAFDLAENTTFALALWQGEAVDPASVWLLSILKRACGALAALAFVPLYPASASLSRLVRGLLLATALATCIGFWLPALAQANALILFFTAAALFWSARRHATA
ncbi:MAG: hypothetical protein Kilf2KO_21760 [Rhodospirillales bacterium]